MNFLTIIKKLFATQNKKNVKEIYWSEKLAEKVLEVFPNKEIYTLAAGISPSGVVHFGNFRDVITALAVSRSLRARGRETRLLFSWDDYDRFRKVPAGIDGGYEKYIGRPLTAVPDPFGKRSSYAEYFENEFEEAMKNLGVNLEYRYQTKEYHSGRYDQRIFQALKAREQIADILLSFMSDKAKTAKQIDPLEFKKDYYPISVYSRFTGKDNTQVLNYDGDKSITYKCLDSKKEATIDITKERIVKLAWKVDWPMRWVTEDVVFEPGGHDHASPGGSYDVSSKIVRAVFKKEPPVFTGYQFVGIQGLGVKMSGSKGSGISPGKLLEIYEPELLKWMYFKKSPQQTFSLAFDSEIYRQYEEFDKELTKFIAGRLDAVGDKIFRFIFDKNKPAIKHPIPFRQAVAFGQIVQWDIVKLSELLKALELHYDDDSIKIRLPKARRWLEIYNPKEAISLLAKPNKDYIQQMNKEALNNVLSLKEKLSAKDLTISELEKIVYAIPKDDALDSKENSRRQRVFFKDIYNLLIGKDTGPRLATFLWAVDREKVLALLTV